MVDSLQGAYPHQSHVERARLEAAHTTVTPSGITRALYLDLAEPIVRKALEWQDETGSIIDPVKGEETVTCGARFVGALATLIGAGRCREYLEACARAMDRQTRMMAIPYGEPGHAPAAEFNTRDLMLAILFVAPLVEINRATEWRWRLSAVHPDDLYDCGANTPPRVTHNWVIYGVVGEYLKYATGIADNREWIERMLEQQLPLFTSDGAYCDPNCPITYDLTCRQGLSWMLDQGYRGPCRERIDDILRRGALTTLLTISPTGEAPFGGRSNQFHHMEAMIACFCEFEAKRYATLGDNLLAGAFKRQAHLAAAAVRPWIESPDRWWHIKNRFPPTSLHGCDSYGLLAVYGLLAANLFGVAYHLADESIAEAPTFSEAGGRVVQVDPQFHKVYATCGQTHLQIDLRGDAHYDATGLGRFHRAGVPTYLGLSCPFAGQRLYTVAAPAPPAAVAIGPGWHLNGQWTYLAELAREIASTAVLVERETADEVIFEVVYKLSGPPPVIRERYRLTAGTVEVRTQISGAPELTCLRVPLWETDGERCARPTVEPKGFRITTTNGEYRLRWLGPRPSAITIEPQPIANRNGVYRVGRIEVTANELSFSLTLS
ncbi:MAG: hypothetical protein ACUVX8_06320 [Candidatus Zipacnadales bacterium]